jgi:hypothetical protein
VLVNRWCEEVVDGQSEHTATKVPGKKTMVMTEMDFIALLSRLVATAISRES